MKKIGILSFYGGIINRGVEILVHRLSNEIVDHGYDVTVYQIGPRLIDAKYKTVSLFSNVDWNQKSSNVAFLNHYSLKIMEFTLQVLKIIDKKTDIVFPTNGQWQSVLCSIWAKIKRKKVIISGFSGIGFDDRVNLYTFPDRFIPMSTKALEKSRKINPFVKLVKIPGGVDLNKFKKALNNKNDIQKTVLSVGAFTDQKRHDFVINAVSKLNNVNLIIAGGGGNKKKEIKELGERLLDNRFKVVEIAHDKMPDIYNLADVFTLASEPSEAFGMVLIEAMACGLPVVATDDPIRREIVGNAGLFVDPTNIDLYAEKIKEALNIDWGDKQSLAKLGLGKPRKQAEKFSWDIIASEYEKLFKTL